MEQKSIISEQTRKELDKNTVDFYLSEAEKQLDGVVDVSNRITERAYILFIVADHLEAIENKIALNLEDIRVRTTWYGRCLKICFFTICIIVLILVAEHFTSVWALVHHWVELHCPV